MKLPWNRLRAETEVSASPLVLYFLLDIPLGSGQESVGIWRPSQTLSTLEGEMFRDAKL